MIRRPPRSTQGVSSAASDVYKRQIFNALIIAIMIDLCIKYVPTPSNYIHQIILAVISVIMVGIGGGIYLVSNLGAGPRDGLMIGLQKLTNFPIAAVRATLEISVVSIGWYLGGTVGVGTLLFAFGIGPCVALGCLLYTSPSPRDRG